jgi:EAL domain-containing protein (putative c-di-GMP-specific phosphodiesterase class I)
MKVVPRPRPDVPALVFSLPRERLRADFPEARAADLPGNWTMAATPATLQDANVALSSGQLLPYFQPVVSVADPQCVIAAEALLRWHHPRQGVLRASQFLSVVEEADLLVDADVMTARATVSELERLDAGHRHLARAWVNASVADIFSDRFGEMVGWLVGHAGLGSHRLGIEVPEIALSINETAVRRRLAALRNCGVAIGVDRFGAETKIISGRLPLDAISIDPLLTERLPSDPAARRRLSAVIGFAHGEGIEVTAKGVETWAPFEVLQDVGCDGAQGFLFGDAAPASALQQSMPMGDACALACTWLG